MALENTVVTSDPSLLDGKVVGEVVEGVELDEGVDALAEPTQEPQPIIDYETEYNKLREDRERLEAELSPYRQRERDFEDQQLSKLVDAFLAPPTTTTDDYDEETQQPVITTDNARQIRSLVQAGATFVRDLPNIRQERVAGLAINFAHDVVGDDASVKELSALANEFFKLEDPRLMERWKEKLVGERRTSARNTRVASGVDRTVSSGVGATRLSDPEVIGQKIANHGPNSLSASEKRTYAQWRADRGLPVPLGW